MIKGFIGAVFVVIAVNQYVFAAELIIKNNSENDIITYPYFRADPSLTWITTSIKKGEEKIVLDKKVIILDAFHAYYKDASKTDFFTSKKYKLKMNLLNCLMNIKKLQKSLWLVFLKISMLKYRRGLDGEAVDD